jgi:hypothetical protein
MTFVGADHAPGYRPVCATWVFVLRHPVLGGVDDLTCLQRRCFDGDSSALLHVSPPTTTPAHLTHASMIFTRCVEAHGEADSAVRWFRSCAPDCQPRPTRNVGRLELEQNQGFCPKRIWWLGLIWRSIDQPQDLQGVSAMGKIRGFDGRTMPNTFSRLFSQGACIRHEPLPRHRVSFKRRFR